MDVGGLQPTMRNWRKRRMETRLGLWWFVYGAIWDHHNAHHDLGDRAACWLEAHGWKQNEVNEALVRYC